MKATDPKDGPNSVLNIHGRDAISKALTPLGTKLARAGVNPDAITIVGTIGAVAGAVIFFPKGGIWLFIGTLVIWAFVMLDIVDGAVARASGNPTTFGGVLDSTGDRVADAAIFASVGWYYALRGERWMLLGALLCLILGGLTSYIRARAEAAGLNATVGIAERAERLIAVLVGTGLTGLGVPFILAVALWLLVAASSITVIQRLTTVYRQSRLLESA